MIAPGQGKEKMSVGLLAIVAFAEWRHGFEFCSLVVVFDEQ